MKGITLMFRIVLILISLSIFSNICEAKFIQTFICRHGGSRLNQGDAAKLAKFDIILANKSHYNDDPGIYKNTWEHIKSINSDSLILLYTSAMYSDSSHDVWGDEAINGLDRYNNDRWHPQGDLHNDISLHVNKEDWHLLTANGDYVVHNARPTDHLFDFGDTDYQNYACEATVDNYVTSFSGIPRPWTADGVSADHGWTMGVSNSPSQPQKYLTDDLWSAAMNNFHSAMTLCMHNAGQVWGANAGPTYNKGAPHNPDHGSNSWRALDNKNPHPDMVWEELSIAYGYGTGDIYFLNESDWLRQINLLRDINNMKVLFLSSSDLRDVSLSGADNFGNNFTFWDALWYCLGSYIIGKNDEAGNSYFSFIKGTATYNNVDIFYDEYQKIDLGEAISNYKVTNYGGTNIYWREFVKGYVFVNPTPKTVPSIALPESCKQRSHANLNNDLINISEIKSLSLNGHRAAILYKSSQFYSENLTSPKNLRVIQN